MLSLKHICRRLSDYIKLILFKALALLAIMAIASSLVVALEPVSVSADVVCPSGWSGTYPDCTAPTDSQDITPRDIHLVGFGIALLIGWLTVKAFRFRRDG